MLGIYIHVPFCVKRCGYCAFCSSVASASEISRYSAALIRNIRAAGGRGLCADTVYFGGGTPSLLSGWDFSAILSALRESFDISPGAEITVEANPETVDFSKLAEYKSAGANRISFGVQSGIDNELSALGRVHDFKKAAEAVSAAKSAGITNISCDLMLGIPRQTLSSLAESIDSVCSLGITHLSAYMLKIEEGTAFDCPEIRALAPDDDTVADMYLYAVKALSERGFKQYEISNFSLPGFESRHNLKYWTGEPYLGFGPSAHSFFGGKRFFVPPDIKAFIESPLQETALEDDSPDLLEEYILLGLRLSGGISLEKLASFGGSKERFLKAAEPFVSAGMMKLSGDSAALTTKGFLVSNGVIFALIDSQSEI